MLDAPNKEAIEKHHDKIGAKCNLIMEIKLHKNMRRAMQIL
jgi:hypothetical protein